MMQYAQHRSLSLAPRQPNGVGVAARRLLPLAMLVVLLVLMGIAKQPLLRAQDDGATAANRERRIEAACPYQFGRHIERPAKTFPNAKSTFPIGVFGDGVPVESLRTGRRVEKIHGRAIRVLRFTAPDDVWPCHPLFPAASLPPESQAEIIRRMVGCIVPLAGEPTETLERGACYPFCR